MCTFFFFFIQWFDFILLILLVFYIFVELNDYFYYEMWKFHVALKISRDNIIVSQGNTMSQEDLRNFRTTYG